MKDNEWQKLVNKLIVIYRMEPEQIAYRVEATASAVGYWKRGEKEPRRIYQRKLKRLLTQRVAMVKKAREREAL